jgi:hypothetical protein
MKKEARRKTPRLTGAGFWMGQTTHSALAVHREPAKRVLMQREYKILAGQAALTDF